jgi:hypothetical protein
MGETCDGLLAGQFPFQIPQHFQRPRRNFAHTTICLLLEATQFSEFIGQNISSELLLNQINATAVLDWLISGIRGAQETFVRPFQIVGVNASLSSDIGSLFQ